MTVGNVSPVANNQIFTEGTKLGDKFYHGDGSMGLGETHMFEGNAVCGDVLTIQLQAPTPEALHMSDVLIWFGKFSEPSVSQSH